MKKFYLFFTTILFSSTLFALPGFSSYVPDLSGQYVYYEDKTFERTSYIGFLMYDEKTYSARYFAPYDKKNKNPELNIQIYFTIDEKSDHIELTGEQIVSAKTQNDTEIINYLHDLLYEFSARRKKIGTLDDSNSTSILNGINIEKTGKKTEENFVQFGGKVTIVYDYIIPFFNLREIENSKGKKVFFLITLGQLASSEDKSFENFTGFSAQNTNKNHKLKVNSKAKKQKITTIENRNIELDDMWEQKMQNVWTLQNAAVLTTGNIPSKNNASAIRQMIMNSLENYIVFEDLQTYADDERFFINAPIYQKSSSQKTNLMYSIKVLCVAENGFDCFMLTIFDDVYQKNKKYFDTLQKSYY